MLISGGGTNLQALLAAIDADDDFGGEVVVVGADRRDAGGLAHATGRDIPVEVHELADSPDRATWEATLADRIAAHDVDIVVLAGFMKILSAAFVARWPDRIVNTHPALLPAFRGAHAVRDALAAGVKVAGATVHLVDVEVDAGAILGQRPVAVEADDDEESLHARIRAVEHELLPDCVRALCQDRVERVGDIVHIRGARNSGGRASTDSEEPS